MPVLTDMFGDSEFYRREKSLSIGRCGGRTRRVMFTSGDVFWGESKYLFRRRVVDGDVDSGVDDLCKVGMVSRVGLQRVQGGEVLLRWSGTKWLQSGNVENR
jgi:hypothetical protein